LKIEQHSGVTAPHALGVAVDQGHDLDLESVENAIEQLETAGRIMNAAAGDGYETA
jgi:hypothetical protein